MYIKKMWMVLSAGDLSVFSAVLLKFEVMCFTGVSKELDLSVLP
jgi:hypothetical protein